MTSLYARRNSPFVLNHSGVNTGKILDLRIHWTADDIVTDVSAVAPGETRLVSVANDTLVFAARHPIYSDVCFQQTVSGDVSQYLDYLTTNAGPYQVNTASGMVAYQVVGSAGDRGLALRSPRIALMLDLNYPNWVDTGTDIGLVEPFNVIFDYVPQATRKNTPVFTDANSNIVISGNCFTNTPISGGTIISTAHRFSLTGDTLVFLDRPEVPEPPEKILSINGIRADHGGITIKTLI